MLYHYTDRLSAADIRRDGRIKALPATLYQDSLAVGPSCRTKPIVWLTTNPILDGTVVVKMISAGWPKGMVGDLCRFSLHGPAGVLPFADYVYQSGIDPDWWNRMVETGAMVGSHYTTWMLADRDIETWDAVEVLEGFGGDGATTWKAFD
jgi:hypothetical protein